MKSNPAPHNKLLNEDQATYKELLDKFFAQARAQFGDAVKAFWFYEGDFCPGCMARPIGVTKLKGENALSLNGFIYRPRGVLIGRVLGDVNRVALDLAEQIEAAANVEPVAPGTRPAQSLRCIFFGSGERSLLQISKAKMIQQPKYPWELVQIGWKPINMELQHPQLVDLLKMAYSAEDLKSAQAKKLDNPVFGFWDGSRWVRFTAEKHHLTYEPHSHPTDEEAGYASVQLTAWSDPSIANGP